MCLSHSQPSVIFDCSRFQVAFPNFSWHNFCHADNSPELELAIPCPFHRRPLSLSGTIYCYKTHCAPSSGTGKRDSVLLHSLVSMVWSIDLIISFLSHSQTILENILLLLSEMSINFSRGVITFIATIIAVRHLACLAILATSILSVVVYYLYVYYLYTTSCLSTIMGIMI